MRSIQRVVPAFLLLAFATVTPSALAQATWEPFDGISKLVDWFGRLNTRFEEVVAVEKRGQLLRSVDRLRRDLYSLEADTRILQDNIFDTRPNAEQKEQLQKLVNELMSSVKRLSGTAREVGADLRLNEGLVVESALTQGLRTRARVLTYLQDKIEKSDVQPWNAEEVRARLGEGLRAVRDAQLAVTAFRQKLASAR